MAASAAPKTVEPCGGFSTVHAVRINGQQVGKYPVALHSNRDTYVELDFTPANTHVLNEFAITAEYNGNDLPLATRELGPLQAGVRHTATQMVRLSNLLDGRPAKLRFEVLGELVATEACA